MGINTGLITDRDGGNAESVDWLCIDAFHTNCLEAGNLGILVLSKEPIACC